MIFFCLLVAWALMRYGVVDAVAAWKGNPSPRTTERAARVERAQKRIAGGPATIGDAVSGRIANRIANPPERKRHGPMLTYLAGLWDDSWSDAGERRLARRDRRREREQERDRPAEPPTPHPRPDAAVVIDIDPNEEEAVIVPEPVATPPPPVDPSPDLTQTPEPTINPSATKETPVTSTEIPSGDITDPGAAVDLCIKSGDVLEALFTTYEQTRANAEMAGVAADPIQQISMVMEALQQARAAVGGAQADFEKHVAKRDEIASDPSLAGTQKDGWLDASRA